MTTGYSGLGTRNLDESRSRREVNAAVAALRDEVADLDLTDDERRIMGWLERWEIDVMANVASVIRKARAAV